MLIQNMLRRRWVAAEGIRSLYLRTRRYKAPRRALSRGSGGPPRPVPRPSDRCRSTPPRGLSTGSSGPTGLGPRSGLEVDRGHRWQAHFFRSRLASRIAAAVPFSFRIDLTRAWFFFVRFRRSPMYRPWSWRPLEGGRSGRGAAVPLPATRPSRETWSFSRLILFSSCRMVPASSNRRARATTASIALVTSGTRATVVPLSSM